MGWIEQAKSIVRLNFFQIQFLIVLLVYIGCILLFFQADVADIHTAWITPQDLDFGYLVFALAIFLIVRNARYVDYSEPLYWPLLALVLMALIQWVGSILGVRAFLHLSIVLSFPFVALTVFGRTAWKATWVPCCVVVMALPVGYLVLPYLQQLTIYVVTFLIRLTTMTAYIEGAYIHVPEGVIWIKEGCSGHKYFITAGTLALMVIAYDRRGLFRSLPVLGLALFLSIAANWVRVFVLVLVGYFSGMDHPLMDDHDNLGWFVFVVMMAPFFYLSSKLAPESAGVSSNGGGDIFALESKNVQGEAGSRVVVSDSENGPWAAIVEALGKGGASLGGGMIALLCAMAILLSPKMIEGLQLVGAISGKTVVTLYSRDEASFLDHYRQWYPKYVGATKEYHKSYPYLGDVIDLSVILYAPQSQTGGLASSENSVLDKSKWLINSKRRVEVLDYSGANVSANVVYARKSGSGGEQRAVVYWHRINGQNVRPGLKNKFLSLSRVWRYKSDDMLFALGAVCRPNCALAEERLIKFIENEGYFSVKVLE